MSQKFKFILIGMLVLLIMVGVLSLGNQTTEKSGLDTTQIVPKKMPGTLEPTEIEEPKEKDIRPE